MKYRQSYKKKDTKIFIHIGAYKTGTTFLQKNIFPFWPNMQFTNDLWFSYLSLVQENKKYIISNETLFGRPWARDNSLSWAEERQLIFDALARLFPNAHILLFFRKHSDFILSLYKQYLHEGGILKFNDFFDFYQNKGLIKKEDINYMDTIKRLEKTFEFAPYVFTLEQIDADLNLLIKKLEKIFDEKAPMFFTKVDKKENVGVQYWQAKILRILNIIDRKPWSYIKKGGLVKLTNPFTLKHRIDPRSLCQTRLRGFASKALDFDNNYKSLLDSYYAADWSKTEAYISCLSHQMNL